MNNKFEELKKLLNNAYAPYSKFLVASIVIPEENANVQFIGVNVENASYGGTICAERSALCSMATHGYRKIKEIHIISTSEGEIGYPCGICRQFISEFADPNTEIYIYNLRGEIVKRDIDTILPNRFRLEI